jgi:hypothetical protein
LGIDYQDLPCIILTDDFKKSEFYCLRTNQAILQEQLEEIGFRSSRIQYWNPEKQHLHTSFAKVIFDDLSFMLVNQSWYTYFAAEQSRQVISKMFKSLEENRHYSDQEFVERIAEKIFLLLGLASQARHSDISRLRKNFLPIDRRYLEQESEIILRTGLRVLHLLQMEENPLDPVLEEIWDYSPGIMSMAKLFEREINLSIVHFMRYLEHVDLPRYYDKYQPNLTPEPRINRAKLNAQKGGKWLPPALGQSKYAFKDLINQNQLPPGWTMQDCQTLYSYWDIIHNKRNPAAHSSISSDQSLMDVVDSLRMLNRSDYFKKFFQLKVLYKGQQV